MNSIVINTNLIKKINSFLKKSNSLRFLNPYLFETIDKYKETNNMDFNSYYLEYIAGLPKLDFETSVKIAREVYELYGKKQDFDMILERLVSSHSIDQGSLNPMDENCITKATESRILLSGTCYDVVLICHEIGHKLRFDNSVGPTDIMDSFLFETPSIIMELSASTYLKDNYQIDINAEQLRKIHVLSINRDSDINNAIFLIVIKLLKQRKLNTINLYREIIKYPNIMEHLNNQETSIEACIDEVISTYSYDIGYILGIYTNNSNDKKEVLNMILEYKDKGLNKFFTIEEGIIKNTLESEQHKINKQ